MAAAGLSEEHPFPGLRPFGFEDREYFFGRDEQIDALYSLLDLSQFVAVVGSSGSGKSSLVRAGLLAQLERETKEVENRAAIGQKWRRLIMSPGDAPLNRLSEQLVQLDAPRKGREDPIGRAARRERLDAAIRRSSFALAETLGSLRNLEGYSLLLLVDQFEELFRYNSADTDRVRLQEERDQFVQVLLEASNRPEANVHVLTTMRSDFIGDCAQFIGLPEAVSGCQFLVPSLARDQREEVICRPLDADHANSTIEPSLVERLLNDVGSELDQLPVLQHCLSRLWELAGPANLVPPRRQIQESHYQALGGIAGALSQHANDIFKSLPGDEIVVKRVFQSLTDTDAFGRGIRRPQRVRDLVAILLPDDAIESEREQVEVAVRRVVTRFADPSCSFLRVPDNEELGADTVVDIGHEALIRRWDRLSDAPRENGAPGENWLRDEQNDAEQLRVLIYSALIPEDQLADKERWWHERHPNRIWASRHHRKGAEMLAHAKAVLRRSREAVELGKKHQKQIKAGGIVGIALLAACIFFGWQWKIRHDSDAAAHYLAVSGTGTLVRDSASAALLPVYRSLMQNEASFTPEVEALIYSSLQSLYVKTMIPRVPDDVQFSAAIAFHPDGRLITFTDRLRAWDPETGKGLLPDLPGPSMKPGFFNLKVSSDGKHIFVGDPYQFFLVDQNGNATPFHEPQTDARFSPDGHYMLTVSRFTAPKIWDINDITDNEFKPVDVGTKVIPLNQSGTALAYGKKYFAIADKFGGTFVLGSDLKFDKTLLIKKSDSDLESSPQVAYLEFNPARPNELLTVFFGLTKPVIWAISEDGKYDLKQVIPTQGRLYFRGAFNHSGTLLALRSLNGETDVWDLENLEEPPVHLKGVVGWGAVAFNSDDNVAVSGENGVWIFGLKPALEDIGAAHQADTEIRNNGIRASSGPETLKLPAYSEDGSWEVSGPEAGRLLLFDLTRSSKVIARFGEKSTRWQNTYFAQSPDRLVAVTNSDGMQKTRQWRYFKDKNKLLEFVGDHLPYKLGSRISPNPSCVDDAMLAVNPALDVSCK